MTEPVAVSVLRRPVSGRQGRDLLLIACFVAFAGTLGAILHVTAAVPPESAALAAVGTLASLLAIHALARRSGQVDELNAEIEQLKGELAKLRNRQGAPGDFRSLNVSRPPARPRSAAPGGSSTFGATRPAMPPAAEAAQPSMQQPPTDVAPEIERADAEPAETLAVPRPSATDGEMRPFWSLRPGTHKEPRAAIAEKAGSQQELRIPSALASHSELEPAPRGMAKLEANEWPRVEPRVPTSPMNLETMQNIVEQLTGKFGPVDAAALVDVQRATMPQPEAEVTIVDQPPPIRSPQLPPTMDAPVGHLAVIAEAVEAERLDVCLDPILGLDDRRARHFELSVNLLTPSGEAIAPDDYRNVAAGTGLLARLDSAKLARAAAVLLRLRARGSDAALFSAVAGESLADENFAGIFADTLAAEEGLGTHLVLTFAQAEARIFTEAHRKVVADMSSIGLKFALTGVTDLDMDFDAMRRSGFEFVKLDAKVFLEGLPVASGHVPAADICRYFSGLGLGLIVGGIVAERDLAKIMGFGAVLGQGTLFGGPRSVEVERGERRAA